MVIQKKLGFGAGTVFSLIVIYFIYLYSKEKGWALLALAAKWYLIIVGGLIAVSLGIVLLIVLFSLAILLIGMVKLRRFGKKYKKAHDYVDAEYKVKE